MTYSVSSHQLSVVGSGIPRGGWLEAAMGSFGESITHSPDYEFGQSNGADVRPFLVTNENYGGTSTECGWTGNVGGLDIAVYTDAQNVRQHQSEVKTKFLKYSPNLTETKVGAVSADKKLKWDYSFFLNRSDDYNRIYYKVNIEALQNVQFSRFDIFQLGGDIYNVHNTRNLVYGNDTGIVAQFVPTNSGSNDYTTVAIPLSGNNPWVWAGDGLNYTGASSGIDIDANNGMIIRDYKAIINGTTVTTPYFRERSSSIGFSASHGTKPTSYCIVTPPGTTSLTQGDKIELLVEVVVLPKQYGDYYGPNAIFDSLLQIHGNSPELLFREAKENKLNIWSPSNTVTPSYPLKVETINNTGLVQITGGVAYVPVVFTGLTDITNPQLWKSKDSCWELVDQSVHGKDFWQVNFNEATRKFDLIYNVNQDSPELALSSILYYLGTTPPLLSLVLESNLGSNIPVIDSIIEAIAGQDSVYLRPRIEDLASISDGIDTNYHWTGPNGFNQTGRIVEFIPFEEQNEGEYQLVYTNAFGCSVNSKYEVKVSGFADLDEKLSPAFMVYPNPTNTYLTFSEKSQYSIIYSINGMKLMEVKEPTQTIDVSALAPGTYIVELTLGSQRKKRRMFQVNRDY